MRVEVVLSSRTCDTGSVIVAPVGEIGLEITDYLTGLNGQNLMVGKVDFIFITAIGMNSGSLADWGRVVPAVLHLFADTVRARH